MCGRYASARKRIELLEEFRVDKDRVADPLEPDYNVAPTKRVYAVLSRVSQNQAPEGGQGRRGASGDGDGDGEGDAEAATRQLRVLRWGLVPSWAKDPSIGSRMINARAETVDSKPAYRKAFARRRCLLPADGYYEWQPAKIGAKTVKQPFFISRRDGGSLAMAGLYELWRDRDMPDDHPNAWMWTATIITTDAPDELGRIHNRMPMIIDKDHWADWLDPANDKPADLRELLAPATAGGLVWHPVSTLVNSVRHNGPELIEPVELDTAAGDGSG
ncbi:MAG TPA: SOS response-associated peptidase [Streptosporangiaceae bacterium]|jgi:putative SOS response-associated peptidase YedK